MARGIAVLIAAGLLMLEAPAAVAQEPPPREFYGVVSQARLDAGDFEQMGAGQIGTVREMLDWSEIDPTPVPNDLNWAKFDGVVAGAARQGVSVLPTFFSVPPWVSTVERCDAGEGPCQITPPTSEVGLDAFSSFAAAAARRYGNDGTFWSLHPELPEAPIDVWQIWNEPNSPGFWQPRPDVTDYGRLLSAAAEGIREEDPAAEVILGGMFRYPLRGEKGGIRATDFLARLYQQPGIGADFDGVAVHPYAARLSGVKRGIFRVLKVMAQAGDAMTGLWITEIGWSSGGKPNPLNRGPKGQASRLTQAYRWLEAQRVALNLRLVAWFAWRDTRIEESRCAWCARSGLFRVDGMTPKPAWARLLEFTVPG